MKINDKNLCVYSVSAENVDKAGYLMKKGEVNKNFQKRWMVLKGNLLFYFEKKSDREPVGVIILEGCTIELAECEDRYAFKLVFHGAGDRTYILAAESQESLEGWMKALARSSYDYLKLMVSELQKTLDELNETEKLSGNGDVLRPEVNRPPRGQPLRQNPFDRVQGSNYENDVNTWRSRTNTVSEAESKKSDSSRPAFFQTLSTPVTTSSVAQILTLKKRRTFAQLHSEFGVAILRDKLAARESCVPKKGVEVVESTLMGITVDNLIDI